jgi:hypothetical protein
VPEGATRARDDVLRFLDRLEAARNEKFNPSFSLTKCVLLVAAPFVVAPTGLGFKLAQRQNMGFFIQTPLLFASIFLGCALTAVLLVKFGAREVKLLFSRRYLLGAFLGITGGGRYMRQNMALSLGMNASLFFVVMKSTVLLGAIFQAFFLRMLPGIAEVAS